MNSGPERVSKTLPQGIKINGQKYYFYLLGLSCIIEKFRTETHKCILIYSPCQHDTKACERYSFMKCEKNIRTTECLVTLQFARQIAKDIKVTQGRHHFLILVAPSFVKVRQAPPAL